LGLLVGIAKGGTAPFNQIIPVGTQADADSLFGPGSMLARMFKAWFTTNRSTVLYALPIPEPTGTAATGTITVSTAASVAGNIYHYIAGQRVTTTITASETVTTTATKIAAAINAVPDLPVTATSSAGVVTVTAKWKGVSANDVRCEDNVLGYYGGEQLPTGLAFTYSNSGFLAGGTGLPDFTTAIARLGDNAYKFVALPFNDSGTYQLWDLEYGFSDSGRWGWLRQSYGQIYSAKRDTYANLLTWGPTNNSAVISPLAVEQTAPSPLWEWAAAYAAQAARAFGIDPARPLQTLELLSCRPAPRDLRFNKTQLNALAKTGLAVQGTDVDGGTGAGIPIILREQSSYQKNSYGMQDNAYELMTTLATLDEILTDLRRTITNKYPRHKLANNGTRFGPGQAIITPNLAKAELISRYAYLEYVGLAENVKAFKDNLIVVRSEQEPNTLEVLYPPDLINQLRRFNVKAQFRLQFPLLEGAAA
jgi:phage tail sheath gpL-like